MSDELDKKQQELKKIEEDLKQGGLSRRNFLNRLSAVGVGFGAALALGIRNADAANPVDGGVNVASTNPAVDDILAEGQQIAAANLDEGDPLEHMAQYGRRYLRVYRRGYPRIYRRGYPRVYGRGYPRVYGRGYPRIYGRGYPRVYGRVYPRVYGRIF
jgi:hypothetical protein